MFISCPDCVSLTVNVFVTSAPLHCEADAATYHGVVIILALLFHAFVLVKSSKSAPLLYLCSHFVVFHAYL